MKKQRAKPVTLFIHDSSSFLTFLQETLFECQYKSMRLLLHKRNPTVHEIRQNLLPAYEAIADLLFKSEEEGKAADLYKLSVEHKLSTAALTISVEHRRDGVSQIYNLRFEPMEGDRYLHVKAARRVKTDDPMAEAARIFEQI